MLSLTAVFDELLKGNGAAPTSGIYSLDRLDEFLKEAHRINAHIATLRTQLRDVRQAYLSTAQPRKTHLRSRPDQAPERYLTDQQREQIDADAKRLLRDLDASIRGLAEAEELHQETQRALIRRRHASALGSLSRWAAGGTGLGGGANKSREHAEADEALRQVAAHRDGVLWALRQRLQQCGEMQQAMMTARLTREMEKNRSVLAKARLEAKLGSFSEAAGHEQQQQQQSRSPTWAGGGHRGAQLEQEEEENRTRQADELTEEQVQMFEKGNQDMLKHFESTLDKVRTAEKSLVEISQLQTMLVQNLEVQSAHVEQLVADELSTTENVERGNKELTKALNRPSTARYTFLVAGCLCAFMVCWDLVV